MEIAKSPPYTQPKKIKNAALMKEEVPTAVAAPLAPSPERIKAEKALSKKHVSFANGTLPGQEADIALSITRHENIKQLGFTEYTIIIRVRGTVF